MAYRHLELTKTLAAQREILLRPLDGWNSNQLDNTLSKLSQKGAIRIQSPIQPERIISLRAVSETERQTLTALLDSDELKLFKLLEEFISKG
jgi:hypothetical protein